MAPRRYCYKENGYFPDDDFVYEEDHGWVHKKPTRHSVLGDDLDPEGGGGVPEEAERPSARVRFTSAGEARRKEDDEPDAGKTVTEADEGGEAVIEDDGRGDRTTHE